MWGRLQTLQSQWSAPFLAANGRTHRPCAPLPHRSNMAASLRAQRGFGKIRQKHVSCSSHSFENARAPGAQTSRVMFEPVGIVVNRLFDTPERSFLFDKISMKWSCIDQCHVTWV